MSAADTSRNLPPRTSGLLDGQDALTVPTMRAKMAAHIAGLGAGYLPLAWAAPHIAGRRLVRKQVEGTKSMTNVYLAWHPRQAGKALKWFLERLRDKTSPAIRSGRVGDLSIDRGLTLYSNLPRLVAGQTRCTASDSLADLSCSISARTRSMSQRGDAVEQP